MSFVPVTGPAAFRAADPPREGVVEFSDERRTVELPMRAALPVLTRAHRRDDLHPSVGLLSGAALLALRLVAAGHLRPAEGDAQTPGWRVAPLGEEDAERVRLLARARGEDPEAAERVVRQLLDAVADTMPRTAPVSTAPARTASPSATPPSGRAPGARRPGGDFERRLQARLAHRLRPREDDRPQLVTISLRVEADEEELVAGAVRLVLQVHDERNPLHVCDAALLWTAPDDPGDAPDGSSHGFGDRARTHAVIALRGAAEAWPVLDRFLELRVPDQLTLDTDELVSLLEHGVAALAARGVDVLWPRSLGRDLTARTVLDMADRPSRSRDDARGPREEPLQDGLLRTDALFSFRWQLAVHGEPLNEEEMDQLAAAASPILKLRGGWTVVDPATARKARRRLVRTVRPVEAVAAALTGVVRVDPATEGEDGAAEVVVGASLRRLHQRLLDAPTRDPIAPPAGLRAELRHYQQQGLTWLAEMTSLGLGVCLADDMGLGKTVTLIALHLHRAEHARAAGREPGPTLVVCPASLLGNWEAEVRRFAPGVPVRRFHGGARTLDGLTEGFVLTTYGTLRSSLAAGQQGVERAEPLDAALPLEQLDSVPTGLRDVPWDLVVADEAQHVKNPRSAVARALRTVPSRARVALTGTPVENELTELWAILDWATPGLLGSRNAFRKAWAAPIESGADPRVARQFADLVRPFLLRRRKSDPGIAPELPPKTETDHLLRLTREQVVLYEAFVRDTMARIERADETTRRGLVLSLLTGLKQICNHPAHFLKQSSGRLAGRSQKLDLLDELLGTVLAEDGAVLLFTQYVAMGRLLESYLSSAGVPHQFLHGGTPVRERESMVAAFQAGAVPVFLLSLKAGGTGLNLTRADHVVHLDRWWNPAVEDQATDRAYRIGQTKPVQVHRMVVQGTIEERVGLLLERKRSLADSVLARGETALTELDDAELFDLVSYRPER
ncbi:DEAD/DEAH box helicase [Nocardioides ferulae]|uniref:DEAD/DEAH box helicase n=1 Tax=Nocardioides ferulae TaxID=2340821 RepID=UPI00197DA6D7|nr:DEAD/DEAH box helicase [Nocardioides ferulae]